MNNIKVPLIISIIIFFLILLINVVSGNSLSVIMLRSFVSAVISFGLVFGAIFVLTDVLKIDFSQTEENDRENEEQENKVDIVVDDLDISEMKNEEPLEADGDYQTGNITEENKNADNGDFFKKEKDIVEKEETIGENNFLNDETVVDNTSDLSYAKIDNNTSDIEQSETKNPSINVNGMGVKDKLGINASPEDLVKAIRTKISRES